MAQFLQNFNIGATFSCSVFFLCYDLCRWSFACVWLWFRLILTGICHCADERVLQTERNPSNIVEMTAAPFPTVLQVFCLNSRSSTARMTLGDSLKILDLKKSREFFAKSPFYTYCLIFQVLQILLISCRWSIFW